MTKHFYFGFMSLLQEILKRVQRALFLDLLLNLKEVGEKRNVKNL